MRHSRTLTTIRQKRPRHLGKETCRSDLESTGPWPRGPEQFGSRWGRPLRLPPWRSSLDRSSPPNGDSRGAGSKDVIGPAEQSSLVARLRVEVADDLSGSTGYELALDDRRELARQLTLSRLEQFAAEAVQSGNTPLELADEERVARAVLDALFGLGRLQSLIDDRDIENIDVNGCDRVWVTYSDGTKASVEPAAESDAELAEMLAVCRSTLRSVRAAVRHLSPRAGPTSPGRQPTLGIDVGSAEARCVDPAAPVRRPDAR